MTLGLAARRSALAALAFLLLAFAAALAGARGARGEGTSVGGVVQSTFALSLGEPSVFTRVHAGHRRSVYDATIPVEVTATEAPVRLSLADGEAVAGRRLGRLVRGASVLGVPLRAAAGHGRYRSLHTAVAPVLEQWGEVVSLGGATIRLRQTVRGPHAPAPGTYEKVLLVTVSPEGP
jgi:hypothetical protein